MLLEVWAEEMEDRAFLSRSCLSLSFSEQIEAVKERDTETPAAQPGWSVGHPQPPAPVLPRAFAGLLCGLCSSRLSPCSHGLKE